MKEKKGPKVSAELEERIAAALADVDSAEQVLAALVVADAPLDERRAAHRELRQRFNEADALLREATTIAKARSRHDWTHWRHRLGELSIRKQRNLFAEMDDASLLPINSVRPVATWT